MALRRQKRRHFSRRCLFQRWGSYVRRLNTAGGRAPCVRSQSSSKISLTVCIRMNSTIRIRPHFQMRDDQRALRAPALAQHSKFLLRNPRSARYYQGRRQRANALSGGKTGAFAVNSANSSHRRTRSQRPGHQFCKEHHRPATPSPEGVPRDQNHLGLPQRFRRDAARQVHAARCILFRFRFCVPRIRTSPSRGGNIRGIPGSLRRLYVGPWRVITPLPFRLRSNSTKSNGGLSGRGPRCTSGTISSSEETWAQRHLPA